MTTEGPDPMYAPPREDAAPARSEENDWVGWVLLALPAAGGALEAIQSPMNDSNRLVAGAVLMTVVVIGFDAQRRRQVAAPWIFGALCVFAITFPVYMHYRAKWGAPRRLALSLVSVAILLAGMAVHVARATGAVGF